MHPTHTPPTTAEPTPADILRGAAAYLQLHGWTQGDFYDLTIDAPFPPADVAGAIRVAILGDLSGFNRVIDPHTDDYRQITAAQRLLAGHVDPEREPEMLGSIDILTDWNDEEHRTVEQVIAALTDAADDWDRIHGGAR